MKTELFKAPLLLGIIFGVLAVTSPAKAISGSDLFVNPDPITSTDNITIHREDNSTSTWFYVALFGPDDILDSYAPQSSFSGSNTFGSLVSNYRTGIWHAILFNLIVSDASNCYAASTTLSACTASGANQSWHTNWPFLVGSSPASTTVIANDIYDSTTTLSNWTYIILGARGIDSGATWTLSPDSILKFATSSSLTVNGSLDAGQSGTGNSNFFTSFLDDLIHRDTNQDATSTSPAMGDWSGITVNSGGTANFGYSVMRYGGAGGVPMVYNNGGSLTISSSSVAYGGTYGIKTDSGTTIIQGSDISNNSYGIYGAGGSTSILATSTIHDNSSYGVFNNTTSYISAERNYWGDSSGPTYSGNVGGVGDSISDYVDYLSYIGTSTLHFVETNEGCPSTVCASVENRKLLYVASTTYSAELTGAASAWNSLSKVLLAAATSTSETLDIYDIPESDVSIKGQWIPIDGAPDAIELYSYFLDSESNSERQNTITHELGHALGLNHSYTGNVMFFAQSAQTALGPQDVSDFNYLWP